MSDSGKLEKFCKQCRYPLVGLAEDRCPECGRGFDPDDPRTWSPHRKTTIIQPILHVLFHPIFLLVVGWGVHLLLRKDVSKGFSPDYSYGWFVSGTLFFTGILLVFRKKRTAPLLLFLNPAVLYMTIAATGYWTGTGKFQKENNCNDWGPFDFNTWSSVTIEEYTRLPIANVTEPEILNDWFSVECNNLVLKRLGKWLGPATGRYNGPIPTEEEALCLILHSNPIDLHELRDNKITINKEAYNLSGASGLPFPGNMNPTASDVYWNLTLPRLIQESYPPTVTLLNEKCILIQINYYLVHKTALPSEYNISKQELDEMKNSFWIFMIDADSGSGFGGYFYSEPGHATRITGHDNGIEK